MEAVRVWCAVSARSMPYTHQDQNSSISLSIDCCGVAERQFMLPLNEVSIEVLSRLDAKKSEIVKLISKIILWLCAATERL